MKQTGVSEYPEVGLTGTGYGLVVGALGVGGLVGALSTDLLRRLLGRRNLLLAALAAATAMMLAPAVTERTALVVAGPCSVASARARGTSHTAPCAHSWSPTR